MASFAGNRWRAELPRLAIYTRRMTTCTQAAPVPYLLGRRLCYRVTRGLRIPKVDFLLGIKHDKDRSTWKFGAGSRRGGILVNECGRWRGKQFGRAGQRGNR